MTEPDPRPAEPTLSPLGRAAAVVGIIAAVGSLVLILVGTFAQLTS